MKPATASVAMPTGLPHVGNRRRQGYELTKQRDMLPIALGAGMAAVVLHVLAWVYCPSMLTWGGVEPMDSREIEQEETVRVVVRETPREEIKQADPVEETPEPQPEEILEAEPVEIDILDIEKIDELAIMPGETEIYLPQPAVKAEESPEAAESFAPAPVDLTSLPMPEVPPALIDAPEPAPVNSNDVVANITAAPEIDEASALMEKSLRDEAGKDNGASLPGDTRSLAELMGIENPGAGSGVARLGADVLFAFDKCQMKNSARITMLQLAALILKNPTTQFIVEGHTDSFGGEDYNALLALQRAAAVRDWLVKNGVPVQNVYIRPCGSNNPLVDVKGDKDAQSLNRRVEIHLRRADEALPPGCVPHNVKVDTATPVRTQMQRGVRVPAAYASAYRKEPATPAGDAPAGKPAPGNAP